MFSITRKVKSLESLSISLQRLVAKLSSFVSVSSVRRKTIEVRLLEKILQVSETLVPDLKRGFQTSTFSSAEHNLTTY